jgi:hypothetical protein
MKKKIKLNDGSWLDWEMFDAHRKFMRQKELEYWEWVKTQPHLNTHLTQLVGEIRTLQIEEENDSDRTDS